MFNLSNKMFDILKWVVGIVLPALAALYGALAPVWDLPMGEEVVATVTALVLFLGAFLSQSSAAYAKASGLNRELDIPFNYPWQMSGPLYDTLKWIAQVALPAVGVAYAALAAIWGWPFPEQIGLTVAALVAALSAILQVSSASFQKAAERAVFGVE